MLIFESNILCCVHFQVNFTNLLKIEILYTFSWMTPLSIVILVAIIVYKYYSFYSEYKSADTKTRLKSLLLVSMIDFRRLILCVLFFFKTQWYLLFFIPLVIQMLLLMIVLFDKKHSRIDKALLITNETLALFFCAISIMLLNYSPLFVDKQVVRTIILAFFQWTLALILVVEICFITICNIRELLR